MNFQEIRAAQAGADMDAFHVDAPDEPAGAAAADAAGPTSRSSNPAPRTMGSAARRRRARSTSRGPPLKQGDVPAAQRLDRRAWARAPIRSSRRPPRSRPVTRQAFQLFEDAYVAVPSGPSNLIATEVLARTGAAVAVARRLVERPDGKGREGAGTLQTHLHYADCFAEAAEVGTVVYAADPPSKAQTAFEVACSWAKATDVDHAIEWLERAADDGFRAASLVDGEPDLEAVRADPRWPLLRARLA